MNHQRTEKHRVGRGFTLTELLVTIAIIAILSSLSLTGLAVARQRVKADRTELTIRKIHEVIMPHYERFLSRSVPPVLPGTSGPSLKGVMLVSKRRSLVFEMPDGWADLLDATVTTFVPSPSPPAPSFSATALRLISIPTPSLRSAPFSDAECLWAMVMQAGFADPAIVGHFREDEFGDKDENGVREFIDGWGNPIRFLRWAPAFVSRYQPAAPVAGATVDTRSHDALDPGAIDPLARTTLFPLIFSCGPDGEPAITCRTPTAESTFSYPKVAFDPYFVTRPAKIHVQIKNAAGITVFSLGDYSASPARSTYDQPFGTPVKFASDGTTPVSDDVHNHAMSR
jgi:prepilin-type N-terminal cleavage/methylation domain-containing protein